VDDGRPLQLVIAAMHTAPDPEWLAIVDLVAVMLIIGMVLAWQAITGGVCSGKLEQGPDLIIGLIDLAEVVEQSRGCVRRQIPPSVGSQ
jgi:hypothetical protein